MHVQKMDVNAPPAAQVDPGADGVAGDQWLAHWLTLVKKASIGSGVLELGCDAGRDTAFLARHGLRVLATDLSAAALRKCSQNVPSAVVMLHDLRNPFPFIDQSFGVVVGSLCLHYFEWEKTVAIVQEIHRCLTADGLFLCRLNSTRDVHHGANAHDAIEPNYYRVDGAYSDRKRFFDRAAVEALFGESWTRVAMREMEIDRYQKPKAVWEVVVRKRADGTR